MEPDSGLESVARATPDWDVWVTLLRVTMEEAQRSDWAAMVPAAPAGDGRVAAGGCLLEDALIPVRSRALARLMRRLVGATRHGWPTQAAWPEPVTTRLLEAAIEGDEAALPPLAAELRLPEPTLAAIAPLLAMPLLLACNRAWSPRIAPDWPHGYCPVCAAWPVLAEARGLERSRRLRCGRCGGDWRFDWLRCPFCACADHERLAALVPGRELDARRVEVCRACRGYVKTMTTLTATAAVEMSLRDLDTLDLDLVALERGFRRPPGLARVIGARVRPSSAGRRMARWLTR
ncbi:MAG TPA: formate dehydrogenase accessory protein FdhE [Methylomirabilota bacterium]|nr:formate dehydrogenase accessory protein FdhE [Methylomirabilota bacterium]